MKSYSAFRLVTSYALIFLILLKFDYAHGYGKKLPIKPRPATHKKKTEELSTKYPSHSDKSNQPDFTLPPTFPPQLDLPSQSSFQDEDDDYDSLESTSPPQHSQLPPFLSNSTSAHNTNVDDCPWKKEGLFRNFNIFVTDKSQILWCRDGMKHLDNLVKNNKGIFPFLLKLFKIIFDSFIVAPLNGALGLPVCVD